MKNKPKTLTEIQMLEQSTYQRWDGLMYRINQIESDIRMLDRKLETWITHFQIAATK